MRKQIIGQDAFYRRGLVLGLTMAEIVILVIFCLLLAMALLLNKEKEATNDAERLLQNEKEAVASLQEERDLINELIGSGMNEFDDLFKELTIARQKASLTSSLIEKVEFLEMEIKELDDIKKLLDEAGLSGNNSTDIVNELLVRSNELESIRLIAGNENELNVIVDENKKLLRESRTLQGQLQNLRQKLASEGRGTEMPACWASPVTGRPEYIFDVGLTSDGLVIGKRTIPHRADEYKELPIPDGIAFDSTLTPSEFRTKTLGLFRWSVERKCRFFVRAYDLTAPDQKIIYKRHMRILEEHFYKLELIGEENPWTRKAPMTM